MCPLDRRCGSGVEIARNGASLPPAAAAGSADQGEPWTRIVATVAALEATDLQPCPLVNGLFGALVQAAVALPADHPGIARYGPRVRPLCAVGESALETAWARRLIGDPTALGAFPYLDNYVALVQGEWAALTATLGRRPRRVVFIGSGPLPLTALLLHRLVPDLAVTCVDRDPDAVALGRQVAASVAGARAAVFVHAEADDLDPTGFDVVLVAALVGSTSAAKGATLARLASRLSQGALVAVRSVPADGRELLYPRLAPADIPAPLRQVGQWTPPPSVINNVVLLSRSTSGPDPSAP